MPALSHALDNLDAWGRNNRAPDHIQVPHHGSRHNIDTATLDRLLGPTGQAKVRSAIVSATEAAPKHPSPRVANAFMRRGCDVVVTEHRIICTKSSSTPTRPGWGPVAPLQPLDESLEDEE